ncbi:translation initiation factor IF-2-like [Sergentomyia squamirostris]
MAWGYWSATAVDRGRSPRRSTQCAAVPQSEPPPPQCYSPCGRSPCGSPCHSACQSPCQSPQHVAAAAGVVCSESESEPQQVCPIGQSLPPLQPLQLDDYPHHPSLDPLDSPQANQLSDILCRGATVSSISSANNTLTRGASLRDTGDYDIPHPHPHTHHYMTTSTSVHGSRPGSAGASSAHGGHHSGSGSGSSPGISGAGSVIAGGAVNYLECLHYERMPLPIPIQQIPIVPPPPPSHLLSEDEIEPAYATGATASCLISS